MEVIKELMKRPRATDKLAIALFAMAVLYTVFRGTMHTILVGISFTLIVLGALPHQMALAFLVGASAILLVQTNVRSVRSEGFESKRGSDAPTEDEDPAAAATAAAEKPKDQNLEGVAAALKKEAEEKAKSENFSVKKPMLTDNADRREMLELGKAYKLPNENDDKGFHLDSGTTFLNAYKALKPDQIAAMTKDTQELLATQKSLVAMLDSFGPLMKDMGKITGFLGT